MAIDNGSNAIKYRVWRVGGPGDIEQIAERRFPVRLGEGVFGGDQIGGRFAPEKIDEAVACYGEIRRDIERLGVNEWRAVGTSALREASNTDDLVRAIESASGIPIEVIAEREEARLIALGAFGRPEGLAGRHVLIDVGGGSTEIIVTHDSQIDWAKSLPIGAVRLTGNFFPHQPPTEHQYALATRATDEILTRELTDMPPAKGTHALGSGGTLVALLLMAHRLTTPAELQNDPALRLLTRPQLDALEEALRRMTTDEIVATYHADSRRAEILLAGALALRVILGRLGLTAIELGRGGVSEGLLWDWVGGQS